MDIMLDLETLATSPDAAILQIGACAFNPRTGERKEGMWANVHLLDSVLRGFRVDPDTVKWWQDQISHEHLLMDCQPLARALNSFTQFYKAHGNGSLWSHGASFDIAVLDNAYTVMGLEKPWHYRAPRDTRTLYEIAEIKYGWKQKVQGRPTTHYALQDACDQVEIVSDAYKTIMEFKA